MYFVLGKDPDWDHIGLPFQLVTPTKISTTLIQISTTPQYKYYSHQNKYYSWGKIAILCVGSLCTVYLTIVQLGRMHYFRTHQQGRLKEWQSNPRKLGLLDHSFL